MPCPILPSHPGAPPSPAPRPPDLTPTLSPLHTRSSGAGSRTSGRGGAGWGDGVDGGRGRGKGIAALFLEAQPLFSNSAKKKKTQAFQGPVLLADRGDATPSAGSPRASLTRSAAGSPSPRSGRTEGASPGLLGRDGSWLPTPPPGAAAASAGETASLPGDSASRKGTASLPKKEFSLSARFLDSAAA